MNADRFEKLRFVRELAALGEEVEFTVGLRVVEIGEPSDSVYFVLSGKFEVEREHGGLGMLQRGAMFGEIGVITGDPRRAAVICREDGMALRISGGDFVAVLHRQPELMMGLYRDIVGKVFENDKEAGSAARRKLLNFDVAVVIEGLQHLGGGKVRCWEKIGVWGDRSCPELPKHLHCQNCPVFEDAGRSMLDRAATSDYLEANQQFLRDDEANRQTEASMRVVPFRVGDEWFALPAAVFAKVVSPRRVQRIPHRRGGIIEGMVVVHGEIFPTFAIHTLLDVTRTESSASRTNALCRPRHAVIGTLGDRWVFFADEFAAVSDVRASAMTPPPVTLAKAAMNFTKGLAPIAGKTVAILDEELLLYRLKKECGA